MISKIQIMFVAICLIIVRGHMNISFTIKVKILVLNMWSYRSLQPYWLLSLEWLGNFEHIVKFVFGANS